MGECLHLEISCADLRQERDASGPSDFFHGDIAEMIVYRRALSGIERQALEIYLSKKYNIKIKAS